MSNIDLDVKDESGAAPAQGPPSYFQSIFNAALDVYEEKTKNVLLTHPLAPQLQACSSPNAILTVLQDIMKGVEKSRNADEKLFRGLTPTINILSAFSATIDVGAGLVSLVRSTYSLRQHLYLLRRCSLPQHWSSLVSEPSSQ